MTDPMWPEEEAQEGEEESPSYESLVGSFGPLVEPGPPSGPPPIYMGEIPMDNEHGDGVRNPVERPCAGVKGNGMMTPKVYVKSEDWSDYNYSDFKY